MHTTQSLLTHKNQKKHPFFKKSPSLSIPINMKLFAIAATALLASVTYAAPALVEARNPTPVAVDFFGAGDAEFIQNFPADDSIQKISNYHLFATPPRTMIF